MTVSAAVTLPDPNERGNGALYWQVGEHPNHLIVAAFDNGTIHVTAPPDLFIRLEHPRALAAALLAAAAYCDVL